VFNTLTLRRDSFARADLVRATVPPRQRHKCQWCGCREGRFRYWWKQDAIRASNYVPEFGYCSVGCWESHNAK
jgi:hypothetical protein